MTTYSKQHHAPFHIYADEQYYFLTANTTRHRKLFDSHDKLQMLVDVLLEKFNIFHYKLDAFVVLPNHYHLLFKSAKGTDLQKLIQQTHGKSSFQLKKMMPEDKAIHFRAWHNYWDRCVNSSKQWYYCLCYIILNPVKHGYVEHPHEWHFMNYEKWEGIEKDAIFQEMMYLHRKIELPVEDLF